MSGCLRLFENNEIAYVAHCFHDEFYKILVRVWVELNLVVDCYLQGLGSLRNDDGDGNKLHVHVTCNIVDRKSVV